jgi:4-hydroxybenzoate polyprenyltransferase
MNDLVDVEGDRRERPGRPLPSGAISPSAARYAVGILLAAALLVLGLRSMGLLLAGVVLGSLIFLYNLGAKRHRGAGALVMGLCRAGSVGLGVVAGSPGARLTGETLMVMSWWTLYIAAVSWIASREMGKGAYGRTRWLPLGVLMAGGLGMVLYAEQQNPQSIFRTVFGLVFSGLVVYQSAVRLGTPRRIKMPSGRIHENAVEKMYPPAIGGLISALLPMQAAMLILLSNEPWMLLAALLLLLAWPVNRWLANYFAPS